MPQQTDSIPALETGVPATPNSVNEHPSLSLIELYQKVAPSVVQVEGAAPDCQVDASSQDCSKDARFNASGFFITGREVATDLHGASAHDFKITTFGGHRYTAHLKSADGKTGLAVLELDQTPKESIMPLQLKTAGDEPLYGSNLFGLGRPHGWSNTFLSQGTFSKTSLMRDIADQIKDRLSGSDIDRLVYRLDMHTEEGNSGGPIVDELGHVVGIADLSNSLTVTMATPAGDLKRLAPEAQSADEARSAAPERIDDVVANSAARLGNRSSVESPGLPLAAHPLIMGAAALSQLAPKAYSPLVAPISIAAGVFDFITKDLQQCQRAVGSGAGIGKSVTDLAADAMLIGGGILQYTRYAGPGRVLSIAGGATKVTLDLTSA